jgi:hypothetical protein
MKIMKVKVEWPDDEDAEEFGRLAWLGDIEMGGRHYHLMMLDIYGDIEDECFEYIMKEFCDSYQEVHPPGGCIRVLMYVKNTYIPGVDYRLHLFNLAAKITALHAQWLKQ